MMVMRELSGVEGWQRRCAGLAAGIFCVLTLLFALAASTPAFAHAALVATDPADGAVLAESPMRFTLTFSEPVSPLVLTLVGPDGKAQALTSFRESGQTVEIDPPQRLANGTHVLSYRVISADGHPVGGSVLFSIGAASAEPPAAAEPVDEALRGAIWLAKVVLYAGLFFGIGGAFCLSWLAPGLASGRRFAVAMMLCGLPAALLSLGLQGLDALDLPLAKITLPLVWETAAATTFGWTVAIALAALLLGLLAMASPRAVARSLSLVGLAGVGGALAASGHASDADPQWLTRPMVFLHGAGIAFWVGALVPLMLALKDGAPGADRFLWRFSKAILPVVAVLAVAGVVLAVIQVEKPSALVDTAYGRLLLAKLALLAVLFGLAAVNRWRLTVPAEAGEAVAWKKLARSIAVEALLVLAVFGVVAGWRFTPPPRALAIAAAQPVSTHIHALKAMAELTIAPGHAGPVTVSIVVMTGDFGPLDPKEITLVLSKPDSGIEPLKRPARRMGDGTWKVVNLVIPVAGRWTSGLDILISDFELVKIAGPVDIRP
ncbi:MAG: copper resistance CopC/CopD family protein [Mesorhizobium sp.]